jgi:hypothetical protein
LLIAVVVLPPARLIVSAVTIILLPALLKSRRHRPGRIALAIPYIDVGTVSARHGISATPVVALPGGLILRRNYSVGKASAINIDVVPVPTLLDLDQRGGRAWRREGGPKLESEDGNRSGGKWHFGLLWRFKR